MKGIKPLFERKREVVKPENPIPEKSVHKESESNQLRQLVSLFETHGRYLPAERFHYQENIYRYSFVHNGVFYTLMLDGIKEKAEFIGEMNFQTAPIAYTTEHYGEKDGTGLQFHMIEMSVGAREKITAMITGLHDELLPIVKEKEKERKKRIQRTEKTVLEDRIKLIQFFEDRLK